MSEFKHVGFYKTQQANVNKLAGYKNILFSFITTPPADVIQVINDSVEDGDVVMIYHSELYDVHNGIMAADYFLFQCKDKATAEHFCKCIDVHYAWEDDSWYANTPTINITDFI